MVQDAAAAPRPDGSVGQTSGAQHSALLHRVPSRPSISPLNSRSLPLPRRRSSQVSDFSMDGASVRSSSSDFPSSKKLGSKADTDEPSHWHSAPIAIALVPAVAGLLFQNGTEVVTDIMLLALAAKFLNWCVRSPWDWYHAARTTTIIDSDTLEIIPEETIEEEQEEAKADDQPGGEAEATKEADSSAQSKRDSAAERLRKYELIALLACFFGPILGSYMLHTIRSSLSRPSEGLVSNYNLTIFVLVSEIRPISHLIRIMQARTLYLQHVVHASDLHDALHLGTSPEKEQVTDLTRRLGELESHFATVADKATGDERVPTSADVVTNVRQGIQPQLDALNRAVRRYEKKATTQTLQNEARMANLEARLQDALSLAAIAARDRQQPGVVMVSLQWIGSAFALPLEAVWALFVAPFHVLGYATEGTKKTFRNIIFGRPPERKGKYRKDGEYIHPTGPGGQRLQSKRSRQNIASVA